MVFLWVVIPPAYHSMLKVQNYINSVLETKDGIIAGTFKLGKVPLELGHWSDSLWPVLSAAYQSHEGWDGSDKSLAVIPECREAITRAASVLENAGLKGTTEGRGLVLKLNQCTLTLTPEMQEIADMYWSGPKDAQKELRGKFNRLLTDWIARRFKDEGAE